MKIVSGIISAIDTYDKSNGPDPALGTDSGSIGVIHGEALVAELKLFVKAGYPLAEAIKCATYNGAQLPGLENDMGLIVKGKSAHFIVARGTPAQLPRNSGILIALSLMLERIVELDSRVIVQDICAHTVKLREE